MTALSVSPETAKTLSIPTLEIEKNLADTEREIRNLGKCAEAYTLLATFHEFEHERQLAVLRAANAQHGIAERREFVAKLKAILEYRNRRTT